MFTLQSFTSPNVACLYTVLSNSFGMPATTGGSHIPTHLAIMLNCTDAQCTAN